MQKIKNCLFTGFYQDKFHFLENYFLKLKKFEIQNKLKERKKGPEDHVKNRIKIYGSRKVTIRIEP